MSALEEIPILGSLADLAEIIIECLNISGARSVMEIGAEYGDFTAVLGAWAAGTSASIISIEPEPSDRLLSVVDRSPSVRLIAGRSPEVLSQLDTCDAYIVDGDHNYYTVSRELRAIVAPQEDAKNPPLLVLHDVAWPWGRRDTYYVPDALPKSEINPFTFDGGLLPGISEVVPFGIVNAGAWAMATTEGGARNGVQTAVDDFLLTEGRYGYFKVPVIFGLGILYPKSAPYRQQLETFVSALNENPVLERLEQNRLQLIRFAQECSRSSAISQAAGGQSNEKELEHLRAEYSQVIDDLAAAQRSNREITAEVNRYKERTDRQNAEISALRADRDRILLRMLDCQQSAAISEARTSELEANLLQITRSKSWRIATRLRSSALSGRRIWRSSGR